MTRTFAYAGKWVLAAAVAGFLIFGWTSLSRGRSLTTGKTVIRIWDWWNPAGNAKLGEFFDKVKRDFERDHPNIEVRYQFIPFGTQYIQKLMSSFAAGDPPDAFQCSIIWATDLYDRRRYPRPRTTSSPRRRTCRRRSFTPSARRTRRSDGHVFGIPTSMDAYALIINAKLVREAGLDPSPYAIESWDEFSRIRSRSSPCATRAARSPARDFSCPRRPTTFRGAALDGDRRARRS